MESTRRVATDTTDAPAIVLYQGAGDAAAARELLQTRADLLQKQGTNTSSNMQRLLSLESEVRARLAMLGKGDSHSLSENEPAPTAVHQEDEDCCGSSSIPEETSETARETTLPPAPAQRLISYSQSRCNSGSGSDYAKTLPRKTQGAPACRASSCTTLAMATGEQQWFNLARQVSVLQDLLLRTQGLQQINLHRKRPGGRRPKSRQDPGKATESEPQTECIATPPHDPFARGSREPAGVQTFSSGPAAAQSGNSVAPGSALSAHTNLWSGRHSAAEARLRMQRPSQRQQPCHQREHLLAQQRCKSIPPEELRRGSADRRTSPKMIDSGTTAASTVERAKSDYAGGAIHHIRSRSGTPVLSAPLPVLHDGAQQGACAAPAGPTSLAVELPPIHRLPPMAKAIPLDTRGASHTPRPNAGQLRTFPPPRTPREQLAAAAAVGAVAQGAATVGGPLASELTQSYAQPQRQKGLQCHTMQQRRNDSFCTDSDEDRKERAQCPSSSINGLPSPAEIAELLQGT